MSDRIASSLLLHIIYIVVYPSIYTEIQNYQTRWVISWGLQLSNRRWTKKLPCKRFRQHGACPLPAAQLAMLGKIQPTCLSTRGYNGYYTWILHHVYT